MKIKSFYAAGIAIIILFAGIFVTKLTGDWVTVSKKVPRKISAGVYAGLHDPADIRGSYTFGDIANSFPIQAEDLAAAFALDTENYDSRLYQAKDLEEIYGENIELGGEIGTDSIRWVVALTMGYPYIPESDTLLPKPAVIYLESLGTLDEATLEIVRSRSVSPALMKNPEFDAAHSETSVGGDEEHGVGGESDGMIKGNTTFADLYSWGLTKEEFTEITGLEPGKRTDVLRDYLSEQGVGFGSVKSSLQVVIDAKE